MPHEQGQRIGIAAAQHAEGGIEGGPETGAETMAAFFIHHIRFQDQRAKGWGKGEGVHRGKPRGYSHGDAELLVEGAGGPAHARHGNEHRP